MVELYRTTGEPRYLGAGEEVSRHAESGRRRRRRQSGPHSVSRAARSGRPCRAGQLPVCRRGRPVLGDGRRRACGRRSRRSGKTSSRRRCTSPAAAARSTTARRPTARTINRTSRACTRPMAATTSCRTSRPTTKRARRSAACCGTGGCSWRRARRSTSMCWSLRSTTPCCAGVSLDGTNYFYVNPLRQVEPLPAQLRWSRTRVPFVTSYCCPPNVLRTIAEVERLRVQQDGRRDLGQSLRRQQADDDALAASRLKLSQQTNYPWDGRVRITIDAVPDSEFCAQACESPAGPRRRRSESTAHRRMRT